MGNAILAVVVSHFPEEGIFGDLLAALLPQVESILVVDNTPEEVDIAVQVVRQFQTSGKIGITRLGGNRGIAAAANVGIRHALDHGYDYVLLSDQDSRPAGDMVSQLHAVARTLASSGIRVGCVNPRYVDEVTGQSFGFQVHQAGHGFYSIVPGASADPWVEIVSGVASGSLVPIDVFRDVGMMREDFFIDFVDTEWFHRARFHRYHLFGTSLATLAHREGEFSFAVWYLRWRKFAGYSPPRLYYRFRNFIAMCRKPHVSARWKLRAGWYWAGTAYAYLVFSPNRRLNAHFIALGIWHGIINRMGRLDD